MSFDSPAMPLPGGRPSRPPAGAGRPGPDTAADRFRARRQRLSRIRRRVMATGAVTFVALWGVIFDQLIHEHLTSVASTKATTVAASASTGSTSSSGSTSSGSSSNGSSSNGSSSNGGGSSSGTTSSVTTSQS